MAYRVLITDTITGAIVDELEPIQQPKFDVEILTKGSWGVDLILNNTTNANAMGYALSRKHTWVVCWDSYAIQGGLPASAGFDQASRKLSVSGAGIGSVFDQRTTRAIPGVPATITSSGNSGTFTSFNKRRIVRDLFAAGTSGTGAGLPIDFTDASGETGSETRTYNGYDFTSWWSRAMDEADSSLGPEFYFQPYITVSGGIRVIYFALKIGSPLLGDQALAAAWELNAAYGAIDLDYNLSIMPPHYTWEKGSGSGGAMITGFADNTTVLNGLGIPYADYAENGHSDVSDPVILNAFASQTAGQLQATQEQWTASVRIDGKNESGVVISPTFGTWNPGDKPLFRITGHPVLADGSYRRRIYGYSDGDPGTVALKIQPTPTTL